MNRAALFLAFAFLLFVACSGDPDCDEMPSGSGCMAQPDAGAGGQTCPNAIASDENCSACMKDHGAGASYCAASCVTDNDCLAMSSGWGNVPLACHPDGYCTRTCTAPADCYLGNSVEYACDEGRCSACINCF